MYGNASTTWRTRMLRSQTADTARTTTNAAAQTAAATSARLRFIAHTTRGVRVRLTLLLLAAGLSANCATLPGKSNLVKQKHLYVRRHVPFLSFKDVQQGTCSQIEPFPAIKTDPLPDFALIVPNLQHDGHRPFTMKDANDWLNANIAPLLADPAFTKDTVFILTFDEDDTVNAKNNRVFTVLWCDHVQHGTRDDVYDHEDLLATIAALLGVKPPPFDEADVRPIGGIWK